MGTSAKVGTNTQHQIILFDGVCNLCNNVVQFIVKRDSSNKFLFASLQSPFGQQQLIKHGIDPSTLNTFILIKGEQFFQRSNAALEIARNLKGLWPAFYIFKIIPSFIRDVLYNFISRNRYRFFGKRDMCMVPSQELASKFIV